MATHRVHHHGQSLPPAKKRLRATQRLATIARILMAAENAFAERGFAGARTDQIAQAAQVNKALLYYYFKSKRRLYDAVLESLVDQQHAAQRLPQPGAKHLDTIVAFVNGYVDFVTAHPNYPRLMQREMMARGPQLQRIVRDYWSPSQRRLIRAIEEGIRDGEFRDVDPTHTGLSIVAMTVFYFAATPVLREMLGNDLLRPAAVEARRRAILDFIEHALLVSSARKR